MNDPSSLASLRALAKEFSASEYDEDVATFLRELESGEQGLSQEQIAQAASLLLQDEVDFSPELATLGIEPDLELVDLFLACGADPMEPNSYGLTPIALAEKYGYAELAELLQQAAEVQAVADAEDEGMESDQ